MSQLVNGIPNDFFGVWNFFSDVLLDEAANRRMEEIGHQQLTNLPWTETRQVLQHLENKDTKDLRAT